MKAVVIDAYGQPEVLRIQDVAPPVPAANDVLVRVHASTVNRSDCGLRSAKPFISRFFSGLRRPKWRIPGSEFSGVVTAVGEQVTEFAVGDEVFGVNMATMGAYAEYVCIPEASPIALKPAGIGFDEAAAVCDGVVLALTCLRRANVGTGQRVLIYGASGSIGTAGVQLAHHFGAHVTAVCNTKNLDLVRSLGADAVLDFTQTDFSQNGESYDVIFDSVGKLSYWRCRASLAPRGVFVETDLGFLWQNPLWALLGRVAGKKKLLFPIPTYTKADVVLLKELIEAGHYRAVIDRRYPLDDIVEATTYVETAQKTGNVVITVAE